MAAETEDNVPTVVQVPIICPNPTLSYPTKLMSPRLPRPLGGIQSQVVDEKKALAIVECPYLLKKERELRKRIRKVNRVDVFLWFLVLISIFSGLGCPNKSQ